MVHRMRLCLRPNSQYRWLVVGKCCVVNVGDLHKHIFTYAFFNRNSKECFPSCT